MAAQETRFRILGPLEVTVGGRGITLGGPRAQGVLAALLLAEGQIVGAERLMDQVWGDSPPASGRSQVTIAVSSLRKALRTAGADPGLIETVAPGYRVRAPYLDARQAERNVGLARGESPERAATLLRETLELWRGQVLPGMDNPSLRTAADRWEELRLTVLEDWAAAELELGRHRDLVGELGVLVAEHPLRERARGQLMLALHRSGRQAEALGIYERGREILVRELGLEPGSELRETHARILRDAPAGDEPAGVARGASAGRAASPAGRAGTGERPAQLPPAASAFTGRRGELAQLGTLLDREDGDRTLPICVVYGVAGVGKTGLAVSWAHRVAGRFPDGQLFANLRGHDENAPPLRPEAVLARFLRALGVPGERIPAGIEERMALFRSLLEGRRVLVVLDNAASAAQVRPLLPGSASCCVIVTSRAPLGGLIAQNGASCVGLDVLSPEEAEELLARMVGAERIARERPAARRLGELCDRMPLALRIAAGKLMSRSTWTVASLANRLESERSRLDELRQDDLEVRGSFALSYRDLPQPARLAFRRLGLLDLPSGFAAWTVAALAEVPLLTAEKLCEQLVDAQLAQPLGQDLAGQPRYGFHDLVRLFSRERAYVEEEPDARTAAVTRTASCLLTLVEEARQREGRGPGDGIVLGDTPRWLPRPIAVDPLRDDHVAWVESERHTIVAATGLCAALGCPGPAWELAATAVFLYERRAHYDDWRVAAETALRACEEHGDRLGVAMMELCLGAMHVHQRNVREGMHHLDRAIEKFETLDHGQGLGLALRYQASLLENVGEFGACRANLDRARRLLRTAGDRLGQATALITMSHLEQHGDNADEARAVLLEAAALLLPANRTGRAIVAKRLADVCLAQDRIEEARVACEQALGLVREIEDPVGEAYVAFTLGQCHQRAGDAAEAESMLAHALDGARRLSDPLLEGRVLLSMGLADEAAEIFAGLGAHGWHARAVAERSREAAYRATHG
ncbi:AfsR/SARP family transcriptional regulator [Nonomuraea zeae]|nr:AfsR/SARP family transcriptional regulator [Nonomuraea zeae]